MPGRQKPEVKQEREEYVVSLFEKNPNLSAAKANAEVKAKYGSMIRNKRVYEIRKMVQARHKTNGNGAPPSAQRKGKRMGPPASLNREGTAIEESAVRIGLIEGSPDEIRYFAKTWNDLHDKGVVRERVEYVSDTYAVVRG